MADEFTHLHVHTQYSMLDGAVKVKDLVKRTAKLGMKAVAITDHQNMFGAISFYKAAKDAGVQAILGSELDVLVGPPPRKGQKTVEGQRRHLPLLAATPEGYKNLVWLVSRGHVSPAGERGEGGEVLPYDGVASIRLDDLEGRTKGVIGLSGCLGGLVSQAVLEHGEEAGLQLLADLRDRFEPGSFYVELQDHGFPEQAVLNGVLERMARQLDLPLVATNDVHFAERADADAQLYLQCIKTGRSFSQTKEHHHDSAEMYLKAASEMTHLFRHLPEAVKNTMRIQEATSGLKLKLGEPMLPTFPVPEGHDASSYFRHVAREGLQSRFAEFEALGIQRIDHEAYKKRLELELDVIVGMKFPGYFLIVWDFIRYAKEHGIPVGPGRGSGAGSLVAYSMRITDLDPLPYNLLFERFLNPERVSMPDFDIDFCMDKRDGVIRYVQQKYGGDSVGQIATFAELKAKSVVKDVARALAMTPIDAQQVANLIPRKNPAETYTIKESLGIEPKLKARYDSEPRVRELLDQGMRLEGLTRHAGKHAAGIVISEGPLWDHVPVFRDDKSEGYVTQYYKDDVEQAGLVKFDFLGLKTLTVLDIAVRLINERPDFVRDGKKMELARIPLTDKLTYQLLASGETKGVFQLESSGMQQLFKDLKPDSFEDIVAAVALYRPGPLGTGMVKDFVDRKHGRAPIGKMHALVDELLLPTYGVIVYQEQVMQIAQALAGYSLGGADLLRRAMGKKKPEEMAKQKGLFVDGAKAKGVDEADAEHIFGLLEYFAGYGFNKSHSAAYALITYQTAYLKAHYPVELLCGILTSDKDRIDKVVRTIADARALGITVLPPDVNESDLDFKVVYSHPAGDKVIRGRGKDRLPGRGAALDSLGPQIRFGLGAVRGLGEAALETLIEVRKDGGAFRDLFDFATRVDAKRVNKGVFEALVQCGAFDKTLLPISVSRARAYASLELALERSRAASRDREAGQESMFGLFTAAESKSAVSAAEYLECEAWDRRELLVREQKALGFFVSGHPLERYLRGAGALKKLSAMPVVQAASMDDWSQVKLVGMVEGYRERVFKDGGGKVAFFELEDLTGRINVKIRASAIEQFGPVLQRGEPVLVGGKLQFPQSDNDEGDAQREPTLLLNEVTPLIDAVGSDVQAIALRVKSEWLTERALEQTRRVLESAPGACPVSLYIELEDGAEAQLSLPQPLRVRVGDEVLSGLEKIFGEQVAELR